MMDKHKSPVANKDSVGPQSGGSIPMAIRRDKFIGQFVAVWLLLGLAQMKPAHALLPRCNKRVYPPNANDAHFLLPLPQMRFKKKATSKHGNTKGHTRGGAII